MTLRANSRAGLAATPAVQMPRLSLHSSSNWVIVLLLATLLRKAAEFLVGYRVSQGG